MLPPNDAEIVRRVEEIRKRNEHHVPSVHERLIRSRVENVLTDLRWLVNEGHLSLETNARQFAVRAWTNAEALAAAVGLK